MSQTKASGVSKKKETGELDLSAPDFSLWQGDCLEEMGRIPDNSVDMVLTDPP